MRQQLIDAAVKVQWQPLEHVLQVDPRIVPVQLGQVHQTHDDRRSLASELAAGEEPGFASHCPRADQPLAVVVVEGDLAVEQEAPERGPALQAVVERPGGASPVGHALALDDHPGVQRIPERLAALLPHGQAILCREFRDLLLDPVELGDALQRRRRYRARARLEQLVELAPSVRQAARLDALLKFEDDVIGAVVVAGERAALALEERHRMARRSADAEVVDDARTRIECAPRVGPDIGLSRLARAWLEQAHWRLVGVQDLCAEDEVAVRVVERRERSAGHP